MGVAVGDYDNDGFEDLYVTAYGGNKLYHNNGNGTFADVTETAGVAGSGWSFSKRISLIFGYHSSTSALLLSANAAHSGALEISIVTLQAGDSWATCL